MKHWTKCLKKLCNANKARTMGDIIPPTHKNIALLALLVFYTISSSPAQWAWFWNGGRSLKKNILLVPISKHKQQVRTHSLALLPCKDSGFSPHGRPASLFLLNASIPDTSESHQSDSTLCHPTGLQQQVQLNHLSAKSATIQFMAPIHCPSCGESISKKSQKLVAYYNNITIFYVTVNSGCSSALRP